MQVQLLYAAVGRYNRVVGFLWIGSVLVMDITAVILAAGKSTRMKSALPKAIHPICGKPMTRYVVDACREAGVERIVVVVGYRADDVKAALGSDVSYAVQEEQLGTGHAAAQAMPLVESSQVVILPGDSPLVRPETIKKVISTHNETKAAATLLTAILEDPGSYGRIVRSSDGEVERIVEAKDASPEILEIKEVATSAYCFDTELLRESLAEIRSDNAQGEYYLTDTIGILRSKGYKISAFIAEDWCETVGINTRVELAEAVKILQRRILEQLMLDGVTIMSPETTFIDSGVSIGADTVVYPCTVIEGNTSIGVGCRIGPFTRIVDTAVGDGASVLASNIVGVRVVKGSAVGPFENASCGVCGEDG